MPTTTNNINSDNGHSNNGFSSNGHSNNGHGHHPPPPNNNNVFQEEDDKPLDIRKLIGLAKRYWLLLIVSPIICIALAVVYLYYTPKMYKTTATILIKKDDKQKGSKPNLDFDISSLFSGNASNTADEVEILKSRTLMAETLTELKINPVIYEKKNIKKKPFYNNAPIAVDTFYVSPNPEEDADIDIDVEITVIDNQNFDIKVGDESAKCQFGVACKIDSCFLLISRIKDIEPYSSFIINIKSVELLSIEYLKKLEVTPIKGEVSNNSSNTIEIGLEDKLPKRGIDIVNKMIEVYNRFGIEDKNSGDKNALTFIDQRISLLTGEVKSGDIDIETYKKSQGIIANPETAVNFTLNKFGVSDSKITELEIKKSVLNSLLDLVKSQNLRNEFELMPTNLVDNTSTVGLQIMDYNKMILERVRLLKFAEKTNNSVVVLESQIASTRNLVQENINASLNNLQQEIAVSLSKFKTEKSAADQELRRTPSKERGLLEITRLKTLKESIYLFLLQKREEIALSLATTVESSRILDTAWRDAVPVSPKKKIVLLIALIAGLAIPIGIINIILWLKDTIENEGDIKQLTSTPFLGYVTMGDDPKKQIVVEENSRTSAAETFRLLRSNLQFMMASPNNKTVLVTSSMSGEGKSFIALNLGLSLALTNKKTVIIGFDLRKPKLTSYLQNTSDKADTEGVTNYLIGSIAVEKIVHQSKINPFLYYISSGPIPPNPSELIAQERTSKLFEYLKSEFDFVIIDSPPVGMVVDAIQLSKYASTSLYITRQGVTKKEQLSIVDLLHKEGKLPNVSVVLNGVRMENSYGYGYRYGYGYAYGDENKRGTKAKAN